MAFAMEDGYPYNQCAAAFQGPILLTQSSFRIKNELIQDFIYSFHCNHDDDDELHAAKEPGTSSCDH